MFGEHCPEGSLPNHVPVTTNESQLVGPEDQLAETILFLISARVHVCVRRGYL